MPRKSGGNLAWPLLVAAVGAAVYLNTLGNGFALDDIPLVRDDPRIRSLAGAPHLFLEPYWHERGGASGLYRPVTNVSLALNRALLGADPWGFHLGNVLLHALASALVWLAARRVSHHYGTAFLAGMLFAVHPIHTEAVANVAGRAELLAAVGAVGAWLAHARAREAEAARGRWAWTGAAAALYLAAILAKESAVAAPLLFALDDLLVRGDAGRGSRHARRGALYGAYGAALALGLALRARALGGLRGAEDAIYLDNPAAFEGFGARLATSLWVLCRYVGLLVWPGRLSSDYSYDAIPVVRAADDPRLWLAAIGAVILVLALGIACGRSRPAALGLGAFLFFFLPSANLLFPTGTLMAERLAYLPSFGFCLLVGHVGASRARLRDGPRGALRCGSVVALTLATIAALGARTWQRNPVWRDNASLALHDVARLPRSAKLQAGAGIVLHERGRLDDAEARYRRAIEIYPDYAQIHYNLGVLLLDRGRKLEAVERLVRAALLSPANPRPAQALLTLVEQGDPAEAASVCRRLLAEPGLPPTIHEPAANRLAALESVRAPSP